MYGKQALDYIHRNGRTVALGLGLLVVAGGAAYYIWKRRRQPA
jgi:LPXTG-motif cell wall-anchored protein